MSCLSYAQILDDTTKLLYGPHTTKYVTEEEIFNNSGKSYHIDTSLNDFHNYEFLYKDRLVYQNLGNFGTPTQNLYYTAPLSIGKSLGFNSFDIYANDPSKVKYYDTRSPFSTIRYTQGSSGQQYGKGEFARNIRPNWNFGFEISRLTANKIIGARAQRERLADHTLFLAFTRFFTKDSTYQILANYSFFDHKNFETGGVRRDSATETNETFFNGREENVNLYASRSLEKRSIFHLYQQLSLPRSQALQLFHVFDFRFQRNRFTSDLRLDSIFYPGKDNLLPSYYNAESTNDRTDYQLLENKVGIKGKAADLFYTGYFRRKDFTYTQFYPFDSLRRFNENFIGGGLRYDVFKETSINANAEYLVTGNYLLPGIKDYLLKAEFVSKYLTGGYYRVNHSPTLVQMKYYGNNLSWNHLDTFRFNNTTSDNLYARGNLQWKVFSISPGINFTNIRQYIYFDTLAFPAQEENPISVFSFDLMFKFKWRSLNLENYFKYTNVSDPDLIQVPEIYNHSRVYIENKIFKNALLIQLGADFFWRSTYYANKYMPITQQFYLNNDFPVNSYLIADVFLNAQIKKVNVFIKFSHINQGLPNAGYFSTPYYPGLPRTFQFGLRWHFFD
jgi:hypothetical protein